MKTATTRTLLALTSLIWGVTYFSQSTAQTTLADQPVFSVVDVPGNLVIALSVEYPTANSVANLGNYSDSYTYLGYFDPAKCYSYQLAASPASSYFKPAAFATGTFSHSCSGYWSGNFMNWATMPTIDPFRWALTGGYRTVDTTSQTIIDKSWQSGQGGTSNYPDRGTYWGFWNNSIPITVSVSSITPFSSWTSFNFRMEGNGNRMVFGSDTTQYASATGTDLNTTSPNLGQAYQVYVRVDVCDASTPLGVTGLETNCVQYGSNYKPEGLIQKYSNKIRFGVFGYPNADGAVHQGGLLREPIGFLGPTYPTPLSTATTVNSRREWDATTGIMNANPDPSIASASGVTNSGVMNYINGFGQTTHSYMYDDDVSILYYAAVRYFENLGNVSAWTSGLTTGQLDNFPAVTSWTDPILYSCQKNFILGMGDDHTHYDYNVGGGTATGSVPKPPEESSTGDPINHTETWLQNLETLEGMTYSDYITSPAVSPGDCCYAATYYIAGLAYGVHVNDIRPEAAMPGVQTISTYWMDVEEYQVAENLNQYYLATKYGGFTVPTGYSTSNTTTPLPRSEWDTINPSQIYMDGYLQYQPDNYFLAGNPALMVSGLTSAFQSITGAITAQSTSFSINTPNVTTAGTETFASGYNSVGWTGTVVASTLTFDSSGNPVNSAPLWTTDTTFQAQLAGSGWNTGRNIVTWNGTAGIPFEAANLTSAQRSALLPTYSPTLTCTSASCPYLNYLRGDTTNQVGSTITPSTQSLRARPLFLGDIVDSSLASVPGPYQTFSDANDPGYSSFKSAKASRTTMVYAGANDGMLHAFRGTDGVEQFAYVPSALFQGPNGTPQVDGLEQLGNPNYVHHNYVDATPLNYDIDLNHTGGSASTGRWATLLIGGLGKGGKSYYALDITDPDSMTSESTVASKVKWEFTDSTMGYSFGEPVVVKTRKYGWVVILTSGYDNSDQYGYLYFVNPDTGVLLEKVKTPSQSLGLAQASAYVKDYSDDTADSVYVGDLQGQLWRFDLHQTTGSYPQPTLLATVTDSSGVAQPITTAPLIEIHPVTRLRYVMVSTGQLLSTGDVIDTQTQTFYAIKDGSAAFGGFLTVSTPITRSVLTQETVLTPTSPRTIPSSSLGWYTDLGNDMTTNIGWRTIINPVAYNGIVSFTTLLPGNDPCNPGGASEVYALDYSTATSVLQPTSVGYESYPGTVINDRFTGDNGTTELIVGFSSVTTPLAKVPATLTNTPATRILNWRVIPTLE